MAFAASPVIEKHGGGVLRYRIIADISVTVSAIAAGATLGTITDSRFIEQLNFTSKVEILDANKQRTQALGAVYGQVRLTNAATGELTVDVYGPTVSCADTMFALITIEFSKSNVSD